MIPPEPRLDLPFLILLICAIGLSITTIYFALRAKRFEKELGKHKPQNSLTATQSNKDASPKMHKKIRKPDKGD